MSNPIAPSANSKIQDITYRLKNNKLLLIDLSLIAVFFLLLHLMFFPSPSVIYTYPSQNTYWNDYENPIEIEFDRPIREDVLELHLNQDVDGQWEYVKSLSFLPFSRIVQFYPKESLIPEELIRVYIVNFDQRDIGEYSLNFYSAQLPNISNLSPMDGAINIMPNSDIEIYLDSPDGNFVTWDFRITPALQYDFIKKENDKFILRPKEPLKQTTKYKIEIFRTAQTYDLASKEITSKGNKIKIHESTFTTIKAPLIESVRPEGTGILSNEKIIVVFDEPMKKEEVETAFSINPKIEGTIEWLDDRTFQFTPISLDKETKYTVSFAKGITSNSGGSTEDDVNFEFTTIGAVLITGFNPDSGNTNVDTNTNISITFDQEVDHASAQSKFSLSPTINGTFSWNGNTMIFNPYLSLNYSTKYTISIASGVKSIYGLDSKQTFTSQFITRSAIFLLNVPQFYQKHSFGCNSTAAAMAMTYKGVATTESQIYYEAGAGPQDYRCGDSGQPPYVVGCSGGGDPHIGWVPNYGIYWEPIAQYANNHGLHAQVYQNWNLTAALKEVQNGNPVVIWWQNGVSYPTNISYTASDGRYITAINGMHSVVIIGFSGTPEAPTLIYYNDPGFGPSKSMNPASFNARWTTWNYGALPAEYTKVGMVVR